MSERSSGANSFLSNKTEPPYVPPGSRPRDLPTKDKRSGLNKFALRQLSARNLNSLGFLFSNLILLSPRVIFASIVINLFGLAIPIAILQVYDRIIPNPVSYTHLTLPTKW